MNIRLWFVKENPGNLSRVYSRVPSSRRPDDTDMVLIPRSQIERCQRQPVKEGEAWPEHHLVIPDWLAEKKGL